MSTYEFNILVDEEGVTGEYGLPGGQPQPAGHGTLSLDPLTLDTVTLMNRWLSFWDLIAGAAVPRMEHLLQPSTLEVLGTQLWRLILENEVGDTLREKIPKEGKPPLRLSIEFGKNADATLKGLPWEFLFEPQNRWFLSTKTELLLTRYVSTTKGRVKVAHVGDKEKLRVLLIGALPDDDRFATHREALWKLKKALKSVPNLDVLDPIGSWNAKSIAETLRDQPCHIVHVVGICRGAPGNPQIYLGGGVDGFQDPRIFVETLTATPSPPRLVILQLCDYVDGDATENFERLAPALIEARVPAVLALQYPAKVDQADQMGLGKQFYQSLVDGEHVGAAVQASRARLQQEHSDRRFGTPVLYLQEDGALRPKSRSQPVSNKSTTPADTRAGLKIKKALMDVVINTRGLEEEEEKVLLGWVIDLEQIEPVDIANMIKDKLLTPLDMKSRGAYIQMLSTVGRLEKQGDHARF